MESTQATTRRRTRRGLAGAGLLVAAGLALAGCSAGASGGPAEGHGSASAGPPVRGQNLDVQIQSFPRSLDAYTNGNVNTVNISHLVFEGLFAVDAHNDPKPMLVKDYAVSDDGLTYTFRLRPKVTFQDGAPLTAKDVVASLKYWMRVDAVGTSVKSDLASLTATDGHTVTLTLKKPRYPLVAELAGSAVEIMEAKTAEASSIKGFDLKHTVGTGPYRVESWKNGQELVLTRYDGYRSRDDKPSGYAGAKHAYLKTITFHVVTDPDSAKNGLVTGQWDYVSSPTPDQYAGFGQASGVGAHTLTGGKLNLLFLNHHTQSLFSKAKARDALNLAIDKKAINAVTCGAPELCTASGAFAIKDNKALYSLKGEKAYRAHDPKRAKRLFAEAGYSTAHPVRIITTGEFQDFTEMATLVQQQLKSIGVASTIKKYDFTTMMGIVMTKPDAWDIMPLHDDGDYTTPRQTPIVEFPALGYDSPDMKAALADYDGAGSAEEAHAAVDRIQALIWRDKPGIGLAMTKPYAAYTDRLRGYQDYWFAFWNSWLAKG